MNYAMLMAVMEREAWTDHRLDDLNQKVDEGFARVDRDIKALDKKIDDGFARVDKKIDEGLARVDKRVDEGIRDLRIDMKDLQREINERLESMNNRLVGGLFVFIAALIGSNAF
jgi:peptidoglycan hydrolase CwlO-like protein